MLVIVLQYHEIFFRKKEHAMFVIIFSLTRNLFEICLLVHVLLISNKLKHQKTF